jgi:hypothetical protein
MSCIRSRHEEDRIADSDAGKSRFRETAENGVRQIEIDDMTGEQSRGLKVGDRVCWGNDKNDQATVIEKDWSGVTLKWDNRGEQSVMHNDMAMVFPIPKSVP